MNGLSVLHPTAIEIAQENGVAIRGKSFGHVAQSGADADSIQLKDHRGSFPILLRTKEMTQCAAILGFDVKCFLRSEQTSHRCSRSTSIPRA